MADPLPQPENSDTEKNEIAIKVSAETHEYVKGSKLASILVAVTLAYFLAMLDTSIVATWTFLGFFLVFEIGSAICGAAKSSAMFTVGRAFAGMGASGILNGSLTIWTASVSPQKLPVLQSTLVAIGQLGVALGPLLGGALTQFTTWRWCFYINLPVGALVGALLLLIQIPEMAQKQGLHILRNGGLIRTLDLVGFIIFAPAAVMFFLALEFGGNRYAWDSSIVIGLLCGAVATFAIFLVWEWRKGSDAMIPFELLRVRIQWCASLLMFAFLGMMFVVAYYLPIYLQAVKGDSPFMSGVHNLPTILSQVVMVLIGGTKNWILSSISDIRDYIGFCWFGSTFDSASINIGMVVQMPFIAIQTLIPRPNIPSALAILIFTQYFGAALFVTSAQSIFNNSMRTILSKTAPEVDIERIMAGGATALHMLEAWTV
ncbi:hypothetical protein ABKA04_003477 [Annulohypoxylon sp. FPYF3050]